MFGFVDSHHIALFKKNLLIFFMLSSLLQVFLLLEIIHSSSFESGDSRRVRYGRCCCYVAYLAWFELNVFNLVLINYAIVARAYYGMLL